MRIRLFVIILCLSIVSLGYSKQSLEDLIQWSSMSSLPAVSGQSEPLGVAGPFAGISNGALIVAGGANFDKPYWSSTKQWHSDVWVLENFQSDSAKWHTGFNLDLPIGYGASVTTPDGVVCIGGDNSDTTFDKVFLISWDSANKQVIVSDLPDLPSPCAYSAAAAIEGKIYLAGGQSGSGLDTAMNNFWMLDLSKKGSSDFAWQQLSPLPAPARAFNQLAAQHNGQEYCIYLIGGRYQDADGKTVFLNDVYEYSPLKDSWRARAPMPVSIAASTSASIGQSHIFVFGGADGSLFETAGGLKDNHPGFNKTVFVYHTITDTWTTAGNMPACHVTTTAIKTDNGIIIPSGEIRPRVRTPDIMFGQIAQQKGAFGWVNYSTIGVYLAAMILVGVYFSTRNKNTDDFFRGGQRVPWWAAGMSIFATMLSSITFVAIPARAYSSDWMLFLVNMMAIVISPFVIFFVLPFFRNIDATSAYEYLEKRFNVWVRLFGSLSFVIFQVGRMAIVMFLPALALSTITTLTVVQCILIMGVLSIIYCTLGGLEAVIWTDSIQTVVLLGGAVLSFILIISGLEGGFGEFFAVASESDKLRMVDWNFSGGSYMVTALWVIILGGLGQSLIPYTSDQSVIQRYISVKSEKMAAKSILTNAFIVLPASLLFFGVGTALFVFYKSNPEKLDPTFQNDAIFPLFIARELPIGIAGLVVAGIFAAAQSTVSTSMNSISTVVVTDFVKRFDLIKSEKAYLSLARFCTFFFGVAGTVLALLFATADIKSLWESFMSVLGLIGGAMCGLFLLGMFTTRVQGLSAIIGAVIAAAAVIYVKTYTSVNFLLYGTIGIALCIAVGYLISFALPGKSKNLENLTIHSLAKLPKSPENRK